MVDDFVPDDDGFEEDDFVEDQPATVQVNQLENLREGEALSKQRQAREQAAVMEAQQKEAQNPDNWTLKQMQDYYKANPPKNVREQGEADAALELKKGQVERLKKNIVGLPDEKEPEVLDISKPGSVIQNIMKSPLLQSLKRVATAGPIAIDANIMGAPGRTILAPYEELAKQTPFKIAGVTALPFIDPEIFDGIDKKMGSAFLGYTSPGQEITKQSMGPLAELDAFASSMSGMVGTLSSLLEAAGILTPEKAGNSAGSMLIGTQLELMTSPNFLRLVEYPFRVRYQIASEIFNEIGKFYKANGKNLVVDEGQFLLWAESKDPGQLRKILADLKAGKYNKSEVKMPGELGKQTTEIKAPTFEEATKVQEIAKTKQPILNQALEETSKKLGLTIKSIPVEDGLPKVSSYLGNVKSVKSLVTKVERKIKEGKDYTLDSAKDHARGALMLDGYQQAAGALEMIKQKFPDAVVENSVDQPLNRFGYRGIHLTFPMGEKINGEIQIHTLNSWKIKLITDKLYRKWRDEDVTKLSPEQQKEYYADVKKSSELWESFWKTQRGNLSLETSSSLKGTESDMRLTGPDAKSVQDVPSGESTRGGLPLAIGDMSTMRPSSSRDKSVINKSVPEGTLKDKGKSLYQTIFNRFQPIEDLTKEAKKQGADIKPGEDPGLRARGYLGIGPKVQSMLEKNTFRISPEGQIEISGEGLKPIIDEYAKKSPEKNETLQRRDLQEYLIARRTVEDLQRPKSEFEPDDIASPEQVAEAQKKLAQLDAKYEEEIFVLEDTAQRMYDFQRRILYQLVDSGVMSEKQFRDILELNPNYVPFDRVIEGVEDIGTPRSKGRFTGARSPVKKIKGSELEVHDVVESIIKNTYRITDVAERNTVARGVAKLADVLPEEIQKLNVVVRPITLNEAEAARMGGEDLSAKERTIYRPSQFKPKGNVIEYFDGGERKYIEVGKELHEAMTGMTETSIGLLTKIMAAPANWLRTGATITPEFALRNPIRDQWTALMQTNVGFVPFFDTAGAIAEIIGKKEIYQQWIRSGAAYSTFTELSRKNLQKKANELRGDTNLLSKLNIISTMQDFSQLFEQGTRLAIYKRAKGKGMTDVEAGFESRESTLDFARRGSKIKDINAVVAFFNAGLQGFDKSARASAADPGGFTLKGLAAITIPSLLLYLVNRQDEDYKEIPRWQRDLFWVFKIPGTEQWARIPKPFLYGQIFGSLPERVFEFLETQDAAAFDKFGKTIIESLTPFGDDPVQALIPTAVKPLIENKTNYSFFLKRQIVPEYLTKKLPSEQYRRDTSEIAKELGRAFNTSPAQIENIVTGYLGGTGKYLLEAGDISLKAGGREIRKRPKELTDAPLLKGFLIDPPRQSSESIQNFYEAKRQLDAAYLTFKGLLKEGDRKQANKVLKENPGILKWKQVDKLSEHISDLGKRADAIAKSDMDADAKRKKIADLDTVRLKVAQKANKLLL